MLKGLFQLFGGVIATSTLLAFAYNPKRDTGNMESRFITSSFILGLLFYCHEIVYFDPSYKLFGVMAMFLVGVGALTGGVVGVLLPVKFGGVFLGIYLSLLLSAIAIMLEGGIQSILKEGLQTLISIHVVAISASLYVGYQFQHLCTDLCISLCLGLLVALTADSMLKDAFVEVISAIFRFDSAASYSLCVTNCYVKELTILWVVVAVLSFIPLAIRSGVLSSLLSSRSGFGLHGHSYSKLSNTNLDPNGASKTGGEKQRTLHYPDTLEFNYLDPDSIPELLESYADSIFTIVQMLSKLYGFQVDNARNQAEHLLMLLFNETQSTDKLISGPAYRLHSKIFANYRNWCDRMGTRSLLMRDMSLTKYEILIEDILVFLLVWGEAANLRHMPECLCCLFHKTMQEHIMWKSTSRGQLTNGKLARDEQNHVRYPGFFLDMVITPIYEVVAEALNKSSDHVEKKTYDDFNEFFWSPMCIKYRIHDQVPSNPSNGGGGVSMEDYVESGAAGGYNQSQSTGGFFNAGDGVIVDLAAAMKAANKTYLEKRSWLHPLYSMHRVFEWHVITFTLLSVWAFCNSLQWTYAFSLQVASFIFWEITFFSVLWTALEVWTVFPKASLSEPSTYGFLIRLIVGYLVLAYQTVYFHWSFIINRNESPLISSHVFKQGDNVFWWWQYVWLSLLTSSVYFIECLLCWNPSIVSGLLSWNNEIVQAFLNICYPFSQLYVGKVVNVPQREVFGYIFFWLTLISFKLWFGYRYVVFPVTVPTLELYDDYMNFESVSFLKTSTLIFFWWFPHFLVYIIDLSIWYAVWSSIFGGAIAIVDRQGAVRESRAFRLHFMRAPLAIVQKMMPSSSMVNQKAYVVAKASTASLTNLTMTSKPVKNVTGMVTKDIKSRNEAIKAKKVANSLTKSSNRAKSSADLQSFVDTLDTKSSYQDQAESKSDLADTVAGFLDVRSQRWVIFAKIWNEIINHLRENDEIGNAERDNFLFTNFDWLSKPTYLPLYQTAGSVGLASIAFKDASVQYLAEKDTQKKMMIIESFSKSMVATFQEAVHEAWELTTWMLSSLLGDNHMKDFDRITLVIFNWTTTNDIFARMSAEGIAKIIHCVSNIVTALKGCLSKRKLNPVAGTEFLLKYSQEAAKMKDVNIGNNHGTGAKGMKKSVSTGFLSALSSDMSESPAVSETNNHNLKSPGNGGGLVSDNEVSPLKTTSDEKIPQRKPFTKLQPFRKGMELVDNVRDKVREEMRTLFGLLRSALKMKGGVTPESQDLIDRITFVLSLETGFIWNDVYASMRIDNFAVDPRSSSALNKLNGLLKLRITQVDLKSREAKRRLNFFMNSLFMDMPSVPSTRFTKEYTVMTPFYSEDVLLSKADLESKNSDGVSTLLYLQTLYKDDWNNFLERRNIANDEQQVWSSKHLQQLRCWASLRAQTLYRTVEGMMHSEAAIRLFAELEQVSPAEVEIFAKLKFNYVVACQVYGQFKKTQDPKADDIEFLLAKHPNLRVAYIDNMRVNKAGDLSYFSVLVKHDAGSLLSKGSIKEVYRVQLPGNPVLGEGKPENQNHAIIFTRGRFLQAIDMNQDGYFEESLKMRNLLEEFESGCVILGFREHIFTGSVSSVANYMALQELSFVTLGQRVLNQPLRIRQHYGHPDLFNKLFVMTQGGMSKASKGINLSEDVFSGFNATIRGQTVGFKEYVQVGKGRDVGLQQTYKFEAKLSQGNAEQSLSRDLSRICDRLDFFRLMSFYYGGIGHYMANTMVMFTLVVVVYTMLALAVYDEEGVNGRPMHPEGVLQLLLSGMGLLQTLPLIVTLTVEKGFMQAMSEIGYMFLSGGPLYFIFHIQTKCYYFSQTLLAGGAMYRPTGRGFVTRHSPFDENFRFFASSHIYLGFELMVALILFSMYTKSKQYFGLTWSLWLTVVAFLMGPFWFNPLSFEWNRIQDDYMLWMSWMAEIGGSSEQSWDAWWREENNFYHKLSSTWKIFLIVQKCLLWVFISRGLAGHRFLTDKGEQGRFLEVVGLFFVFFIGNWVVNKLERYLSYAVRRFASLCLTTFVMVTTIYLTCLHTQYIRYTVAIYYFFSSIAFLCLVMGTHNQIYYMYKLHDYIVGHSIFVLLILLAMLQLGYFQTWLLYYDALSAGVEMKDILKYARRSKERSSDETEIIDQLKLQVSRQEKIIQDILSKGGGGEMELGERSSLTSSSNNYSSGYKGGSFGYGSVSKEGGLIVVNPLNTSVLSDTAKMGSITGQSPSRIGVSKVAESPRAASLAIKIRAPTVAAPTPLLTPVGGGIAAVKPPATAGGLGVSAFPPISTPTSQTPAQIGGLAGSSFVPVTPQHQVPAAAPIPASTPAAAASPPAAANAKEDAKQGGFVFSQPTQFPSRG